MVLWAKLELDRRQERERREALTANLGEKFWLARADELGHGEYGIVRQMFSKGANQIVQQIEFFFSKSS